MFDAENASQATKDMLIAADNERWDEALDALRRGAEVEAHTKVGPTALARAMHSKTPQALAFARALLENGADPRSQAAQNPAAGFYASLISQPATAATMTGNVEGVRLLAEFGRFSPDKRPANEPREIAESDPWMLATNQQGDRILPLARALWAVDPISWTDWTALPDAPVGERKSVLALLVAWTAVQLETKGLDDLFEIVAWPQDAILRAKAQSESLLHARRLEGGSQPSKSPMPSMALARRIARDEARDIASAIDEAARKGPQASSTDEPSIRAAAKRRI